MMWFSQNTTQLCCLRVSLATYDPEKCCYFMTSHWITECPHCDTSFRVTEQHLRAAKGSVRCGSCLQIFNAIDTLFPDEASITPPETTAPTYSPITPPPDAPEPTPDTEDEPIVPPTQPRNRFVIEAFASGDVAYELPDPRKQWEEEQAQIDEPITNELTAFIDSHENWHDDNDYLAGFDTPTITTPELDTPFVDTPLLDETFLEATANARWDYENDTDYSAADAFDEQVIEPPRTDDEVVEEDVMAVAEEPFIETVEPHGNDIDPLYDDSMPDFESGVLIHDDATHFEEPSQETVESPVSHIEPLYDDSEPDFESDDENDEALAAAESDAVTHDEPVTPPSTARPLYDDDILLVSQSRIPNQNELHSENVWQASRNEESDQGWQTIHEEQEPHIGPYREPFRDALLSELEAEPPRGFQWHEARAPLSTKLWWSAVSFLLVLILGVQHVVFHYGDFASTLQKPPFDGWMRSLCATVSCNFIKTDVSLVTNEDLIIRAHPTQAGFLVVDTMLLNRAPFTQPFPSLDLSFSDMQDKIIARRIFKPSEYLTGDLENLTDMPVNTPLHISFSIKNPSELATNYRLNIIANVR
jgi:predicted Zn finger-like uncharacterized protein